MMMTHLTNIRYGSGGIAGYKKNCEELLTHVKKHMSAKTQVTKSDAFILRVDPSEAFITGDLADKPPYCGRVSRSPDGGGDGQRGHEV